MLKIRISSPSATVHFNRTNICEKFSPSSAEMNRY